jgi:hypothetical protein
MMIFVVVAVVVALPCFVSVWQFQESLTLSSRQTILDAPSLPSQASVSNTQAARTSSVPQEKCAIILYGLPRAFRPLVLPSVVQHVMRPNAAYGCDYFVHYYNLTAETAGRSGAGGLIHAEDILVLHEVLPRASPRSTTVLFCSDTHESFQASHHDLLHEIVTARDTSGGPLYSPWLEQGYDFPHTILNIIQMWHSIDRAWTLMQHHGRKHGIRYTRVAMLRSDVVYLTPLDIWGNGKVNNERDVSNEYVVVPSFARYPVNDRAIYGNASGVEIWATGRFSALAQHVEDYRGSGYLMHHEHFLDSSIFASIRTRAGVKVAHDERLCFCRARADQRVWYNDCTKSVTPQLKRSLPRTAGDWLAVVERAVNRTCGDEREESVPGSLSILCH